MLLQVCIVFPKMPDIIWQKAAQGHLYVQFLGALLQYIKLLAFSAVDKIYSYG